MGKKGRQREREGQGREGERGEEGEEGRGRGREREGERGRGRESEREGEGLRQMLWLLNLYNCLSIIAMPCTARNAHFTF